MKKLAIGALGVGALAVAGALATSYYIGGRIEQAVMETAQSWTEGGGVTVQVLEYDRGMVRSHATTLWSIEAEDETYKIKGEHDIVHGPWPRGKAARVVSRFQLPEGSDPVLVKALGQQAPLEWTALADWSGATDNQMHSPKFKVEFEDGSTLTWGGMQMEWTLSADLNATKGFMRMPALHAEEPNGSRMDMEQAELTFDAQIPQGHAFWVGPTSLKIGRIAASDAEDQTSIALQGIMLSSRNELQQALLQADMALEIDKFDSDSFQGQHAVLQLQAKNINAAWFEQWLRWLQNGTATAEQENQLIERLPELLAGKPELQIQRLSMDSSAGPVALSAYLRYVGKQPEHFDPGTDLQGQFDMTLPLPLLKAYMDGRVRGDYEELLEQMDRELDDAELQAAIDEGVNKRLDTLLANGILVREGDAVRATLHFSEGAFLLNNQPQTLQQLLGIGGAL